MADALITRLARDRPRGGAAHRHGPPLRRPTSTRVEAGRQLGVDAVARRAAAALGLAPAPHRPAGPDRRRGAAVGRPLRRGVHAPLRRRGHGGRARGDGPRGGAERRGAPAARPPPDGEPRGLPGLLPRPLLLGPLLPAVGREGDAQLSRGHGPRSPLRAAARGPRRRVPRRRLRGGAPAARGLGPRRGVVPAGAGPRRPDPGAPRLRGLPPPPAGHGTGTARSASCGAPSSWRPTPPPLTSGSASSSTFAAAGTKRPGRCGGPKSWTRCRWSSRPSSACTTPSAATTRPSSPRRGARSSSTRTSSSATGRVGERPPEPRPPRRSGGRAPRALGTWPRARAFMEPVLARSLALAGRADEARALLAPEGARPSLTLPGGDRPPRAGRDGRALELLAGRGRAAGPLDRDPRRRPDDCARCGATPAFEELVKRCAGMTRGGRGPSEACETPRPDYAAPSPPFDSSAPSRIALR